MAQTPPGGPRPPMSSIERAEVGPDGLLAWDARTTSEVADAVRWLGSQIKASGGDQSAAIAALTLRVEAVEAEVDAQAASITTLQEDVATIQGQVTDLEARVTALENPTP